MAQSALTQAVESVDPSWRGLYRAGGISALLYTLLAVVVPTAMVLITQYDFNLAGPALLQFIADHTVWWLILQTLLLGGSIFAIVGFIALFVAIQHLDKSYAALGAIGACTLQLLFMAYYPVLLGLTHLSGQYPGASAEQQSALVIAAEALIAQNNAFNPLYEALFGISTAILSLVMLKGVFPKWVAYVGVANAPAAIVALSLWPVLGVGYFWWWVLFVVWFTAVGWHLYRLGSVESQEGSYEA